MAISSSSATDGREPEGESEGAARNANCDCRSKVKDRKNWGQMKIMEEGKIMFCTPKYEWQFFTGYGIELDVLELY